MERGVRRAKRAILSRATRAGTQQGAQREAFRPRLCAFARADAAAATNLATVVGPVKWGGQGPFKNVSKTPLVLGQWVKGTTRKYDLVIVNNQAATQIPTGGTMKLM